MSSCVHALHFEKIPVTKMEAKNCKVATALVQVCDNGVDTEVVGGVGKEMRWILLAELTGLVNTLLEGCEGKKGQDNSDVLA